jgi:hypothetical protein
MAAGMTRLSSIKGITSMKSMRWLFVLCLAWTMPTLAVENLEQTFVVGADVNALGEVTAIQPAPNKTKPIEEILDLAVKHWRFVPAQRDGKAVSVHTFVVAKVEALPGANGRGTVRVTYELHGPRWDSSTPRYPAHSLRIRETGIVAMTGTVEPDGKIILTNTRSWVDSPDGSRSALVKAATDWFTHSNITPETVDGQPVSAQIKHYFRFNLYPDGLSHIKPKPPEPMSPQEWRVVKQAGFKDNGDGKQPNSPEISSVLQTSDVRPITIQL